MKLGILTNTSAVVDCRKDPTATEDQIRDAVGKVFKKDGKEFFYYRVVSVDKNITIASFHALPIPNIKSIAQAYIRETDKIEKKKHPPK